MTGKCKHFWNVVHLLWQGRKEGEVGVMRYCRRCGLRQAAFTSAWRKIPRSHPDMNTYDTERP